MAVPNEVGEIGDGWVTLSHSKEDLLGIEKLRALAWQAGVQNEEFAKFLHRLGGKVKKGLAALDRATDGEFDGT